MTQPELTFGNEPRPDVCARRHGGDPESLKASQVGDKDKDQKTVLRVIMEAKWNGLTIDEAAVLLNRDPNCISGRFSELVRKRKIMRHPDNLKRLTRRGCQAKVWIADAIF